MQTGTPFFFLEMHSGNESLALQEFGGFPENDSSYSTAESETSTDVVLDLRLVVLAVQQSRYSHQSCSAALLTLFPEPAGHWPPQNIRN